MKTKRSQEGVVLIDHRNSPGITHEFVAKNKLDVPVVGASQCFESALVNCHCCGGDVILNPDRSRDRHWCWLHDAYTCDTCAVAVRAKGKCVPLKQIMFEAFEKIARGTPLILSL